jgi:hypothetical protein
VRSELWTGGEAQLGIGNQATLDAGRIYSSMGLVQKVKLGEHWSADAGIDRVNTLRSTANPLGPAQPLASGTAPVAAAGLITGDYTAVTAGLAYRDQDWSANARAEWRGSSTDTKVNLLAAAQRQLGQGRVMAAGLTVANVHGAAASRNVAARLSYAYRPDHGKLIWLDRLEYVEDSNRNAAAPLATRKLINNLNLNWQATRHAQVAVQYGAKYVRDLLGDSAYSGYTDLVGVEARHDLGERWDVGVHAGALHSWRTRTRSYQLGASVGYRVTDNAWVSVGYNQRGFTDRDFAGADTRSQGAFVSLRLNFDQNTFGLNDRGNGQAPLKF